MINIYIKASQSLYLKTILPILPHIKGKYFFYSNIKSLLFKNQNIEKIISNRPTNFNIINLKSILYISKLIEFDTNFFSYNTNIKFTYTTFTKNNSVLICTTKDLIFAKKNYSKFKKIIVVGYQHLPILGIFDISNSYSHDEIYNNPFFVKNNFHKILKNIKFQKSIFLNLIYQNKSDFEVKKNSILVFHPGGYRNIISNKDDNKIMSYQKQLSFFKKVLTPLLNRGFFIYIKIHPLCAKYHTYYDMHKILISDNFFKKNILKIKILDRQVNYIPFAQKTIFNLTFGSSAIYELWSLGIVNNYICRIFKDERSDKFNLFKDITLMKISELSKIKKVDFNKLNNLLKNTINYYRNNISISNQKELINFLNYQINE